ncbi:MAG: hypothetical protein M0R80_21075 [Proteobacteria bacterium]|jgi:hypothetical protein|nr:hypothetical protein [Pseudomonadota bacterium]
MGDNPLLKKITASLAVKEGRCPNGHSLMTETIRFDGQKAVMAVVRVRGRTGEICLNPFYGRFEYKCDLDLKEGDVVELSCPECEASLTIETICRLCNIPMFAVHLPDGGQVEACPKVGCHNHSLKIIDLDAQLERMYVGETKFQM